MLRIYIHADIDQRSAANQDVELQRTAITRYVTRHSRHVSYTYLDRIKCKISIIYYLVVKRTIRRDSNFPVYADRGHVRLFVTRPKDYSALPKLRRGFRPKCEWTKNAQLHALISRIRYHSGRSRSSVKTEVTALVKINHNLERRVIQQLRDTKYIIIQQSFNSWKRPVGTAKITKCDE